MSGKWPGGFIKKTAPVVVGPVDGEGGTASGIWTLDQAADYEKQGLWPKPVLPRELWMWGRNQFGQLGQGTSGATNYSSPVQVGSLTDWLKLAGSTYFGTFSVKSDGALWAWGAGAAGNLAQGNITNYSSPVQIGALTDWSETNSGLYHTLANKTDGTLWLWGSGAYGCLGLGNTTYYSSPKQLGALTTWVKVAGGQFASAGIPTDGTLWMWGRNNHGQLATNNTTNYSSPVQVGALTAWLEVSTGNYFSGAVKTDGTLWMWGRNHKGQLGQGGTASTSSPVQVGVLTNWSKVKCLSNQNSHTLALKTDGTLWAWGYNGSGQLGQGNTTDYSSPVQIGALTNWLEIGGGLYSSGARTTAGTIFCWGFNNKGQLGVGDITSRSSPTQVGALTTWTRLMVSNYNAGGIKTS
jgi:alpha-tubulin suppressor-like RCC1 family protein